MDTQEELLADEIIAAATGGLDLPAAPPTLAELARDRVAAQYRSGGPRFICLFGTGAESPCVRTIHGDGYEVAWMRDDSALAVLTSTGYCYGITGRVGEHTFGLWAKVGRLLTQLDEPTRARQAMACGTVVARGAAGVEWYRIGDTVWCVLSATQCHYCGLWRDWTVPAHADAVVVH